ncbi:helix-turn-helix domain-containing protein [Rhodoferax antarcticus]|uniref:HTH cro/C1-type domain-containing protein n=1 Tax=Rhodoferax antarcticus ANT.BR TaxID=1111071 RepID=A0A1Q8Y928_9BURK|nr:helix-turn-helix transcriptional regulator [Rhodoferax antarcticus]OLP04561.1 hypothetical protein BLL52_4126 [Rhodoferax antarcticus ANT.BR]
MEKLSSHVFRKRLGERLRAERQKLGENQTQFAERLGVTKLSLLKYEAGAWCPTTEQLYGLEAKGIDPAYIAFGVPRGVQHSLANPVNRKRFSTVFAKVYKASLTLAAEASEADLIDLTWNVFSSEGNLSDEILTANVNRVLDELSKKNSDNMQNFKS